MTTPERRRETRYPLRHQPTGTLQVHSQGLWLKALAVKDVSVRGVGLYIERPLYVGSPVLLEYVGEVSLKLDGIVTWCRSRDTEDADIPATVQAHVVGVELFGPTALLTAFQDALPAAALSAES